MNECRCRWCEETFEGTYLLWKHIYTAHSDRATEFMLSWEEVR